MAKRRTATRVVTNAGRLRVLEVVASAKALGIAPTESSVEADGLVDLEYDKGIMSFQVQPVTLELVVDGVARKYTPDVRYVRHSGVIGFREFKHSESPPELDMVRKLDAARTQLTNSGYEFDIVESDQLRRGFRMDNLRTLKRYSAWARSQALRERVLAAVGDGEGTGLGELRERVGTADLGSLYRMLWDQELGVDLESARLCDATPVWRLPS